MIVTLEVTLDDKDSPQASLRAASLLAAMAQALRDEAYLRGQKIFKVGLGVTVGDESINFTEITPRC